MKSIFNFWRWFFAGTVTRAGWHKFLDRWLLFHCAAALLLTYSVPLTIAEAGRAVLLPLVGVLVGLSFAWSGNAQALMQGEEFEQMAEKNLGGFEEYVYTYQMAILTILTTIVAWALAGLGVIDGPCLVPCPSWSYAAAKFALYFLCSLTIRECWQVILASQYILLARREIRRKRSEKPDA